MRALEIQEGTRVLVKGPDGTAVPARVAYRNAASGKYYFAGGLNLGGRMADELEPDTSYVSPEGTGAAELHALALRFAEVQPPTCRLCKGPMDCHGVGPDGTTWYCASVKYIGGFKEDQEHWSRSREHIYRSGDEDVINLLRSYRALLAARAP